MDMSSREIRMPLSEVVVVLQDLNEFAVSLDRLGSRQASGTADEHTVGKFIADWDVARRLARTRREGIIEMNGRPPDAPATELEPLRKHFRDPSYEFDVGPGWWSLVLRCHEAVVAEFPEYELLAVKQKWAGLAFQAFPRAWKRGGNWTPEEEDRLDALVDEFRVASECVCERCGNAGTLRETRSIELTLCDACESFVGPDGRL
jgi:hypothetical protein